MKTAVFEGAGWSEADSAGDVGNCRIRGVFTDTEGRMIYLELNGSSVHKYMPDYMKKYAPIAGLVASCFEVKDERSGYTLRLNPLLRHNFHWNKEEVLKVLRLAGCDYEAVHVRNEGWDGFSPTGKMKDRLKEFTK